ncbi:MAG: bifunctional DNA-binding transcriptional regulator/O6-methylguanine-DNA methyltransferase Ada [Desulfocapsaceae bacterium]|nr:bifunctional DNA-binding transcriptional regulator/O6-methylguanine-DNA methyltransferase Ada [Desulfocapsaceae bacterium]
MDTQLTFSTEQSRWQAVVDNNQQADGHFFYAVKTTGIFCRPSCPSRLPHQDNIEFFNSSSAAMEAGYRPCKKCQPLSLSADEHNHEKVITACRLIESSDEPISLADLAAKVNLSPHYFHRLFKRIVGITPKQYGAGHTSKCFRDHLEDGQSVTEAIYAAGYSSSSRAYDNENDRLAMTPTTYKNGGRGTTITYGFAECFLGWIVVAATSRGVCSVEIGESPEKLAAVLRQRFPRAILQESDDNFVDLLGRVVKSIEEPGTINDIPIDIKGSAFQQQVWRMLRRLKPGETASYSEIAARLGKPRAGRAVANACSANPVAVIIPCHRVIAKDGSLSGYRWEAWRKRLLLEREEKKNR